MSSGWATINRGVPQGSILGPIPFPVYVNAVPEVLASYITILFTDDTSVVVKVPKKEILNVEPNRNAWTSLKPVYQFFKKLGNLLEMFSRSAIDLYFSILIYRFLS